MNRHSYAFDTAAGRKRPAPKGDIESTFPRVLAKTVHMPDFVLQRGAATRLVYSQVIVVKHNFQLGTDSAL